MTAELLREAAADMREKHGPEHKRHAMWSAMADWLETTARVGDVESIALYHAEAVARAYLGRDA